MVDPTNQDILDDVNRLVRFWRSTPMKTFLKTLGMIAAAGAVNGAIQVVTGHVSDPTAFFHGETLHQLAIGTAVGATTGVFGWLKMQAPGQ